MALDADLIAYYEAEARSGVRSIRGEFRVRFRAEFLAVMRAEGLRTLLDVGAGPGLDTVEWQRAGVDVVGTDLAHANVELLRARGPLGVTSSLYDLPFRTGSFDALWTMSTFVHVPHARFDRAMTELLRVVRPGGRLAIGTWGGQDYEGRPEFGVIRPLRFFSLASHERWRSMLGRHAEVERFETVDPSNPDGWEYQFAVLRPRS